MGAAPPPVSGERFRDPQTRLYELAADDILVVCPRGRHRAIVVPQRSQVTSAWLWPRRLVCPHCAHTAGWTPSDGWSWGGPVDPFFRLPLWLQTPCRTGHTLWAFNRRHLDLLHAFASATLRERGSGPSGGLTLVARLPTWMTSAKNRHQVLRSIDRLRTALEEC
jgi:hypothetical protein